MTPIEDVVLPLAAQAMLDTDAAPVLADVILSAAWFPLPVPRLFWGTLEGARMGWPKPLGGVDWDDLKTTPDHMARAQARTDIETLAAPHKWHARRTENRTMLRRHFGALGIVGLHNVERHTWDMFATGYARAIAAFALTSRWSPHRWPLWHVDID